MVPGFIQFTLAYRISIFSFQYECYRDAVRHTATIETAYGISILPFQYDCYRHTVRNTAIQTIVLLSVNPKATSKSVLQTVSSCNGLYTLALSMERVTA